MVKTSISVEEDLMSFVSDEAKSERRSVNGQINYMLDLARKKMADERRDNNRIVDGRTQFDVDALSAEDREAILERIR